MRWKRKDAPHESLTVVTTEANDVKTPVLPKQKERAKETNGGKKRMRYFNWLTIIGAFLILLAAAIAWTPIDKISPKQYSVRNITVANRQTATNVGEDSNEQVADTETELPIAAAPPELNEVAENKEVISDAEPQLVSIEQEKELSVDEDATVGSEAASSPVAAVESRTVSIQETSARRAKVYEDVLVQISEIKIGDRTLGLNPQGADGGNESRFAETPHYIYSLRYIKENGTACNIKLLRPADWLNSVAIRYCNNWTGAPLTALDFTIAELAPDVCPIELGVEVWLELDEMGCVGWAKLVKIDTRFQYKPGEGNLVTGTFQHEVGDAIDLYVEGQDEPIGVTETHPFWSVDRQDFVPVGELVEGERLLLFNGETKRVAQKLPRPGPECVYNLEILGEHVYLVTQDGILVHNLRSCTSSIPRNTRPGYRTSEQDVLIDVANNEYYGFRLHSQLHIAQDGSIRGGKGCTIPDGGIYYGTTFVAVEVKNYNIKTGLSSLRRRLTDQLSKRASNARKIKDIKDVMQEVFLDVRGQHIDKQDVMNIFDLELELKKMIPSFKGFVLYQ